MTTKRRHLAVVPENRPTRESLQAAVAGLVDRVRVRVTRDADENGEWQTTPSLWSMLTEMGRGDAGGGGVSGRFGGMVLSVGSLALAIEITAAVQEGADEFLTGDHPDVPAKLRGIGATLTDADLIAWWQETVQGWTAKARIQLRLDPQRPRAVRGARCPTCAKKTAYSRNEDGELVRSPALVITWVGPEGADYHEDADWIVRAVECKACGAAWFRGAAMDSLIGAMLEANGRESLAE